MVFPKIRVIQKEFRRHLSASFPMRLETIVTVWLLGVGSKLIQRPTSIKTCPMEKIYMGEVAVSFE